MKRLNIIFALALFVFASPVSGATIYGLSELSSAASGDLFHIIDVSDTTMNANGTDKKLTLADLTTAITSELTLNFEASDSDDISPDRFDGDTVDDGLIDQDIIAGFAASASPSFTFKDSDCPGTDKEVGKILINYIDGADGSENADVTFQAMQDGSEVTFIHFDESDDQVECAKKVELSLAEIPNGAADVALAVAGDMHLNTTDEQLSFHSAADGEISGEVSISLIQHRAWSFNPDSICDGAVDRLFLFTVGDDAPEGIIIDEWKVSFEADPTTEADLDLKYADAFIGVANAAVIDVLDTTTGASTEDTDANINSGNAVANGKVLYLEFGTAYTEENHQVIFEMWYHCEED